MGHFPETLNGSGLGADEVLICNYCHMNFRPVMVSENIVVGHFAYYPQTERMKKYLDEHPELFRIQPEIGS